MKKKVQPVNPRVLELIVTNGKITKKISTAQQIFNSFHDKDWAKTCLLCLLGIQEDYKKQALAEGYLRGMARQWHEGPVFIQKKELESMVAEVMS